MSNKRVLILGNGISRQEPDIKKFIMEWTDEIWACNWAYKEYESGDLPRLDVLFGDYRSLEESAPYILKKKWSTTLYGKNIRSTSIQGVNHIPVDPHFIKDSGTTAAALALTMKYDEIYIAGFDMGGKDIYQEKHEKRDKSIWIENWRRLDRTFTLDTIHFIGYDHKPFILSGKPSNRYSQVYMKGQNHLKVGWND